jgi:hypothetical protein
MRKKTLGLCGLIAASLLFFSSNTLAFFEIEAGGIVANCEMVGDQHYIDYDINSTAYGSLGFFGFILSYDIELSSPSVTLYKTGVLSSAPEGDVSMSGFIDVECDTYTITGRLYWPEFPTYPAFELSPVTVECGCSTSGGEVSSTSGGEGCSTGFWKNHEEDWETTTYSLDEDFDTIFGVDFFDPDITLYQALWARGGGVNRIARHGTAALLNASSYEVDYGYTIDEVIEAVQNGDVDFLADDNELTTSGFCD